MTMLFGRAQEEIAALKAAGIAFEIIPGVTAALAASAELGISLTQRGVARSVTFVTPRVGAGEDASNWVASVLAADTAAIYMGAGQARAISDALRTAGMPGTTPVAILREPTNVGWSWLVSQLGSVRHTGAPSPFSAATY